MVLLSYLSPLLFLVLCSPLLAAGQLGPSSWTISPYNPSALPLAVRSPYLNAWSAQGNNPDAMNHRWPTVWNGDVLAWHAAVTVDGVAYRILGNATILNATVANQTSIVFTPTQTSVLLSAGPVQINATFLSPVEPTDLVRQSVPFAYFFMTAQSTDGLDHDVSMYSDITAEWISGDDNLEVIWTADVTDEHIILSTQLQIAQPFTDVNDYAHDSTAYYCMNAVPGITWQIGEDTQVRGQFSSSSKLNNSNDPDFRPVSDRWPVFGIAVDVGAVGQAPTVPVVWALGVVRNSSVEYKGSDGSIHQRSAHYWSNFTTAVDVAEFFLDDFARGLSVANELDTRISSDGQQVSSQYADLLSLSLRQVMGSMEIMLPTSSNGHWDIINVMSFMKIMSGNKCYPVAVFKLPHCRLDDVFRSFNRKSERKSILRYISEMSSLLRI